ncbi:MAG: hypothetical protein Q9181_007260 [Wetmoreana brouardii]
MDLFEVVGSYVQSTECVYPLMATALRNYINSPKEGWDSIIRKLLRKGVDIHYTTGILPQWPRGFQRYKRQYLSSLDDLFLVTYDPSESHRAAEGWLKILESEGYSVRDYICEEQAIRSSQSHRLYGRYSTRGRMPRQLEYDLERDPPTVWWDWWTDPDSSALLVLEEFKWMVGYISERGWGWANDPWWTFWPFGVVEHEHFYDWTRLKQRRQERFERRMQKRARKMARANGERKYSKMPGSWFE